MATSVEASFMDITVTMLGESYTFRVDPQDTVGSLRNLIQEKLEVPLQEQKLALVNGQKTILSDDSKPLRDCGSRVSLLRIEPAVVQATEPAVVQATEPAVVQATEPAVVQATEPAVVQATEPAVVQVLLINDKGKTSPYDIKPDEAVRDFMSKVQSREGVLVSQQQLIHEGQVMTGGKLADYRVKAGSTIYLCLRLRGGGHTCTKIK